VTLSLTHTHQIGPYLTVTFLLQAAGPIAMNLYKFYVSAPCKRCYAFPKISSMTSHRYVLQADVNSLVVTSPFFILLIGVQELGKVFDVTTNTAQLQALLFFAMTYSPGHSPPHLTLSIS
jgi:hypothetical protein